ncbi:hypothetical protein [Bosea sp. OAE752]|uniref:hypothetical protein n=1 Tax=Bosea sp. OAE752 TaxID=2663873 RepID=UPI003D1CBF3F
MSRAASAFNRPLDPALVRLIEALAREAARRDHAVAAAQGALLKAQTHACGDLRSVLNRPSE